MIDQDEGPNDFCRLGEQLMENKRFLKIAEMLEAKGRKRIILDRQSSEPYLIRYYYKNYRPLGRIVIHNILRSDIDGLHDHPWDAQTYILAGGYWENSIKDADTNSDGTLNIKVKKDWRAPGHFGSFSSDHFHKLELDQKKAGESTWTLFMMGPKTKEWGFLGKQGSGLQWVDHQTYLSDAKKRISIKEY